LNSERRMRVIDNALRRFREAASSAWKYVDSEAFAREFWCAVETALHDEYGGAGGGSAYLRGDQYRVDTTSSRHFERAGELVAVSFGVDADYLTLLFDAGGEPSAETLAAHVVTWIGNRGAKEPRGNARRESGR
jgi:hypothetical protein